MNHRKLKYIAPRTSPEATPTKRPRRAKHLFEAERETDLSDEEAAALADYRQRQAEKRGFKP